MARGPFRGAGRWLPVLLGACLAAVSCISRADESQIGEWRGDSTPEPSTADGPSAGGDAADADVGGDVAGDAVPDSEGLPSLGDGDPDTVEGTLDNGLRYLIRENDNPGGKVELRLAVDAGSALEDPATQSGVAHFLEHMLFNGTEEFPKNELIDVLRSFGASLQADVNAYTSFDETVYTLTVPTMEPGAVETGLDVLDQWLSAATIGLDDVVDERGIVLDEWRVRGLTASGRLTNELIDLYLGGTVYDGRLPIGDPEAISAMEPEPLRRFYDDWYRPDITGVVVVGDIDAGTVERWLIDRFADDAPRSDPPPDRPELTIQPSPQAVARVASDPDLPEGYALIGLPVERESQRTPEAAAQWDLSRALAFDIVATRLGNDALRGDAPYDSAEADDTSLVRGLTSPGIFVTVDGEDADAAVAAVLTEFERVVRHGFTDDEVERAVGNARSSAQSTFEGRGSRQDRSYADEYVDHLLTGEPYVTAQREYDFVSEVLDRVTPAQLGHVFVSHLDASAPHLFLAVPDSERDVAPTDDRLIELAASIPAGDVAPRETDAAVGDQLMERPAPAGGSDGERLADNPFPSFIDPIVVTFSNGVRVAVNTNEIVEGQVFLEGRSPGGLALLGDDAVPDGQATGPVLGTSGVGSFDRVAIQDFLSDKDVSLVPYVDAFVEGFSGQASTADLEVLLQLVHLTMTEPQADPVALEQFVDDRLPFAEDPSLSPDYAEFAALREARYDDPRLLPTGPQALAQIDAAGVEEVAADRFGDASDWTFSFSGDLDVDDVVDLAASYLATLPSTGGPVEPQGTEEPPPAGILVEQVEAGEGETANVSFLFTASASADRRDDVLARIVESVVSNRLTDFIREELGDSYSPFAVLTLGSGATPQTDLYISVSTAPDQIDEVAAAVVGQLNDLRTEGPTPREFDNSAATVAEELNFFNNGQINDEVLDALVDPEGSPDFDDFLTESTLVGTISPDDVTAAISEWAPADRYIEVRVVPRG